MANENTRAFEIVRQASTLESPEQRRAFLDAQCGDDVTLRGAVESLLTGTATRDEAAATRSAATQAYVDKADADFSVDLGKPGTLIAGRYRLLERIGAGGMGEVWAAQQVAPVQRKVALKLIKAGMDSRAVIVRFEQERQALALMDHPNIARVLDGGLAEDRRPFFVMELVDGPPLTRFCDDAKLGIEARLELFVAICHAVQHAHQKGIIHRDLKPSNILVTLYDGKPTPKVIDFGVAKATEGKLTEATLATQGDGIVGTFEYMAPEQCGFGDADVDVRADIYSLGVVLYELLTGLRPMDGKRLRKATLDEVVRMIREEEPLRPSSRMSADPALAAHARARQIEPRRLTGLLRGELDWIVMKALDKERERRYPSADALAEDVERFLRHEAVEARPPTPLYRARKLIRRNRPAFLAGSLVAAALVAATIFSSWQAIQATEAHAASLKSLDEKEKARAEEARQRTIAQDNERKMRDAAVAEKSAKEVAETRDAETRAILNFVETRILAPARPKGQDGGLGKDVTLRQAIDEAVPFVRDSFGAQPIVQARLRMTLGKSYAYLGEPVLAVEHFSAARALYAKHLGPDHDDTHKSMNNLAIVLSDLERHDEAVTLLETIFEARKARHGLSHPDTLRTMNNLATRYVDLVRFDDARRFYEHVLAERRKQLGDKHLDTLSAMNNLATVYTNLGRHKEARRLFQDVLAGRQAVLRPEHPSVLGSMHNLAASHDALGLHELALELRLKTLDLLIKNLGPEHPSTLMTKNDLAVSYYKLRDYRKALELRIETYAVMKRKYPDKLETLVSMNNLGVSYLQTKQYVEAEKVLREAWVIGQKKHPTRWVTFESQAMLGGALLGQKDYAKAEPLLAQGYERLKKAEAGMPFGAKVRFIEVARWLVELHEACDRKKEAETWRKILEVNIAAAKQPAQ